MCDWSLITWKWTQETGHFLGGCWALVGSPGVIGEETTPWGCGRDGGQSGLMLKSWFVCGFWGCTIKNGLRKQVFWWWFRLFFGSAKVPFGHRWVTYPWGMRIGWLDAEKLICGQIWRMYNWILIIWKWDQGAGCFFKGILGVFWVLVRSPEVTGELATQAGWGWSGLMPKQLFVRNLLGFTTGS